MTHTVTSGSRSALPREKLLSQGSQVLSDVELVAIFLRTGTKGKDVFRLAQEVLGKSGGIRGLVETECMKLFRIPGLGPAKIAELKAVYELARRYLIEKIKKKDLMASPRAVRDYFQYVLRHLKEEVFQVAFLSAQNEAIKIVTLSQGTPSLTCITPREVIKQAFHYGAVGLIFAHNHPSGHAGPSKEDFQATRDLVYAAKLMGLMVYEHLIVGLNSTYSFAESGKLEKIYQAFKNR